MRTKGIVLLVLITSIAQCARAQVTTEDMQQALLRTGHSGISLQYPEYVKEFYNNYNYKCAWVNNRSNMQYLIQLLEKAPVFGLENEDYQFNFIEYFRINQIISSARNDSLLAEIRLTDAAIHFYRDVAYGARTPAPGYNGLNYSPDCFNIPALLADAISRNRLSLLLQEMEPPLAGYFALKKLLFRFNHSVNDSLFTEAKITTNVVNNKNRPLLNRLYYLGITDSLNPHYSNAEIKEKLRVAQRMFNVLDDGVLRSTTIQAMNVPLSVRIEELKLAMNTIRWLRCISEQSPVVVVNIPSASLMVYKGSNILLESKIIVGKKSTPTPVFTSTITDVVLYPYWNVPPRIATRELLPLIKRNPEYLEANSMQVLNKNGKIVNPYTINWSQLSTSNFPYILRQSTGCDNSLGIVKINFYSPYSVYLHDTPWKTLFNFNKRYFSHGCVRVEKAIELAHFLLKENSIAIDTLEEKGCLNNQAPKTVPVAEKVPVFVLYNTAWTDSSDLVQFNDDVYEKLSFANKKLQVKR
jgi:murein L,D-transpeptidase YcbB/YkuD